MHCVRNIAGSVFIATAMAYANAAAQSPTPRPVLVELFTSEGCSSCPPADALLKSLNGTVTPAGRQIIALSEHVPYWDRLGWVDPFSSMVFQDRQDYYGDNLRVDEVYTPQVVVDGTQQVLGNDRAAVLAAVEAQTAPLALDIHILSATVNPRGISVIYSVDGDPPPAHAELYVALTEDEVTVDVKSGENAGRIITHADVVRHLQRGALLASGTFTNAMLPLPTTTQGESTGGRHVIVFAQAAGQGRVLGIATAPVVMPSPAFPTAAATPPPPAPRTLEAR